MKTKFTPIAMRCTQEQFEAIKPKLKGKDTTIWCFVKYPYLCNNFDNKKMITNISKKNATFKAYKLYKTWDEATFLRACGIEVDEPLTISKEFILDLHKEVVWPSLKAKIEKEFSELFEQPTEMTVAEIEQKLGCKIKIVGQWEQQRHRKAIWKFTKLYALKR